MPQNSKFPMSKYLRHHYKNINTCLSENCTLIIPKVKTVKTCLSFLIHPTVSDNCVIFQTSTIKALDFIFKK